MNWWEVDIGETPDFVDPRGLTGYQAGTETEDAPPTPQITAPHRQPYQGPYTVPFPVKPSPIIPEEVGLTNGVGRLPGIETDGLATNGLAGVEAVPAAFPLVAPALAGVAMLSFGFLKRFFFRYGTKALKALIGVAAFKEFMDFLGIGAPDDAMIRIRKGGKRRYSIGTNPRVGTLQKVSRHCQRLLKRHEKVIREFLPKKQPRYGIPPSKALSAIEKAAIRGT